MMLYIDDDSIDPHLIRLLRRDGHDVQVPADVGLAGRSDQVHLAHAIRNRRALLTRNCDDFEALHDLVVFAANGHHAGILVVLFDSNPRNNMSTGDIRPSCPKSGKSRRPHCQFVS
jgi:predicted nuclease of predicted toxin-antitoxin system